MRSFIRVSIGIVASLGLLACGNGATGTDAGSTGDSGGSADIARCQTTAAAVTCGDANRQCAARALTAACATEHADLLADALVCIRDNSDASGCRSFADPSGADTCIRAALAPGVTRVSAVAMQLATLCTAS